MLIDMDGVLVDMLPAWVSAYNTAADESLTTDDVVSYRWADFVGEEKEIIAEECILRPGFFYNLEPAKDSIEVLKSLHEDGHEIVIITTPPTDHAKGCVASTVIEEKELWVRKHLPFLHPVKNHMIYTRRKDTVLGHVLFDDGPHNIAEYEAAGLGLTCVMDYKYNQHVASSFRVSSWNEFHIIVQGLVSFIEKGIAEKSGTNT